MLIILDGWGKGIKPEADAIAQANTPYIDRLYEQYPHSELVTFGEEVGLPEGQMGNSEVGHLNLGAGRVVYQEFARINKAVRERELHKNETLLKAFDYAKKNGKAVHLMGLVSDGGVHSHINHLKALCDISEEQGCENTFIHAFMDGRDTDPKGGFGYLKNVLQYIDNQKVKLASVIGRYYAMDRDKRWERIKLAYDLLVDGAGEKTQNPLAVIEKRYAEGETDEFLKPILITDDKGNPNAIISEGDVVIFFNFRTDRPRQITTVLTQENMPEEGMKTLPLHFVRKTQVRIAETEKYPHVTFFFNGGKESVSEGEKHILISSPKVATYDLQPEMSAYEVTDAIVKELKENQPDFVCLNYANADMVGHTGDFQACIKAVETVDSCLKKLMEMALSLGYESILIADHGNSDFMINDDGSPNTAHTTNMVPCIFVSETRKNATIKNGKLGDIATTILALMGLEESEEMTGEVLISAF